MIDKHIFLLNKGIWLGQGSIQLSMAQEPLKFYMKWKIEPSKKGKKIKGIQEIQIAGLTDIMHNQIEITNIEPNQFQILLDNPHLGKVEGKGIIAPRMIGWEFNHPSTSLKGFEFYHLDEENNYFMHAEYVTDQAFRTEIQGKIWLKQALKELKK